MSLASQVLPDPIFEDSSPVEATLNYLAPMAEKLVNYTFEPPSGIPQSNGTYELRKVPIHNARLSAQELSLDREGFNLVVRPSTVHNFYDEEEVRRVYYPEAEQLLVKLTGAAKAIVFDHNVRNTQRAKRGENNAKEPVQRVHNDLTARSGYSRAHNVLATLGIDNPEAWLRQRFSIINVWRPINGPVWESPLGVCDAQSIAPKDLIASDLVYRDRIGETYAVTYNSTHRWFYFPQMQPDEALLIKCFDSAEDGRARFAAHTAFTDPNSSPDAPSRESIELRTLIFYPD
ncbi:CmcJ/NvfI family oxidoreductase [Leptolyngbya sp. FACHB-261]|uniref:CmcJ/NvfI family oxidoreductase n=1 Tax=Leptolyngbya sp. FACHB-261 TaxID=2692806 RepID=UPI001682D45B|nr:CmcJ/NvfI family oxidoreductase [Leptolyngbya sp. FACHB-261]MBD2101639.1 methyltransferase [Leptolyngbya sp. FACHB-261]